MVSLEIVQLWLTDLSSLVQFIGALLGLCAIILPILQNLPFYYTITYWLDLTFTFLVHIFSRITFFSFPTSIEELHQDPLTVCLASSETSSCLVSGLSNTGNSCFLNSVLQAVSSLPSLHVYLYQVKSPTSPVTNTFFKTIRRISKPQRSRSSIRPSELARALAIKRAQSNSSFGGRRQSSFLMNREQQDAQEFFQVLMAAVESESQYYQPNTTKRAVMITVGLRELLVPSSPSIRTAKYVNNSNSNSFLGRPLTGLLASRLSCVQCGYTGVIRHFSFNNIQLCLPSVYSVTIEQCLKQYTSIEYLRDASCRQCTLLTKAVLIRDKTRSLQRQADNVNKEKRKQLLSQLVSLEKERMQLEHRLRTRQMDSSDDEDSNDIYDSTTDRKRNKIKHRHTISPRSTKQVMIAKPPSVLCLHVTRSAVHHSSGMIFKNSCQLVFNEFLDLTPFVTSGTLHTQPTVPLSSISSGLNNKRSSSDVSSHLYRLMSVVVHYGSHSYGHYVAYKRRILPSQCRCYSCSSTGFKPNQHESSSGNTERNGLVDMKDDSTDDITSGNVDDGTQTESWNQCETWYRISDSKVDPCTLDDVLSSNPYMLFYERVDATSQQSQIISMNEHQQLGKMNDQYSSSSSSSMDYSDDVSDSDYVSSDDDDDDDSNNRVISPATPLDDQEEFSPYYSGLTGTSMEALEMANSLLMMDQQEASSSSES
ncbi:uncharacterized protein BX664DRAFT_280180 [Halteromyces radiatus]|uniref:uncharacterized protein n=1 Tax=Halteromyces radiatus TaxID=101107 RepID=UPI00221FADE4|nr:uncharacterized protein BX664DRAFT_280180 [Halteromyces radiatus]KAI8089324.1 hypothetical protein BX664DRAFT_280180 [Halteromyces radiatus]